MTSGVVADLDDRHRHLRRDHPRRCARHGLRIGAYAVWIVWPLVVILRPITLIAFLLNMLGREMGCST